MFLAQADVALVASFMFESQAPRDLLSFVVDTISKSPKVSHVGVAFYFAYSKGVLMNTRCTNTENNVCVAGTGVLKSVYPVKCRKLLQAEDGSVKTIYSVLVLPSLRQLVGAATTKTRSNTRPLFIDHTM